MIFKLFKMRSFLDRIFFALTILVIVGIRGTRSQCPPQMVTCNSTAMCLPEKFLCDGDDDCGDGEDEADCNIRPSGCGVPYEQRGTSGFISSMNYPISYSNQARCRWHIISPNRSDLTLVFDDVFDLEKPHHGDCVYDSIAIYTVSPFKLLGRFCGSIKPQTMFIDGNEVVVEFESDEQTIGQGFRINWSTSSLTTEASPTTSKTKVTNAPCLFDIYGHTTGSITSQGFEQTLPYPFPYHCRWKIHVDPGYLIAMDFSYFNVGRFAASKCQDAWVKLFDGPQSSYPLIGQFCDVFVPGELLSTSPVVFVEFWAGNNSRNQEGFKLTYVAFENHQEGPKTTQGPPPPGCNGTPLKLTSNSGFLTSPKFDNSNTYGINLDCEWILTGAPGKVLYLKFITFDLEQSRACDFDYLSISEAYKDVDKPIHLINNSTTKQKYQLCGIALPYDIVTSTNEIIFKFHSDDQVSGYGFNISYISKPPPVTCTKDEFLCGSDECLAKSLVCDDNLDCKDGSDEFACPLSKLCGVPKIKYQDQRIVGGQEAKDGAWPWTVSVLDGSRHICGATLILPQWALGAAHCFDNVYDRKYDRYSLMAARHQTDVKSRYEQKREVADVLMPRDYVSQTSYHDIALIKLKNPFNITDYVRTACLPQSRVPVGTNCYVTGWGSVGTTCCQNLLKQGAVPVMNTSLCSQPDYYGDRIKDNMFCAGYPDGGTDACDGDSGGPLVCPTVGQASRWELHGATSWGVFCGYPKNPGVYTRVLDFLPWIQQTIALNSRNNS